LTSSSHRPRFPPQLQGHPHRGRCYKDNGYML
jgi:hypothetical protein